MTLEDKIIELHEKRKFLINEIKERAFDAAYNYCTTGTSLHADDLREHEKYNEELYGRIADYESAMCDIEMNLNYEYENKSE